MPEYAILIYDDEAELAKASPETWDLLLKQHTEFGENHGKVIRGGHGLQPTSTATSVRRAASGDFAVTDGPFPETKEILGGFYIVEAPDLDAAIVIAKDVPAPFGGVEVRPVMVFD